MEIATLEAEMGRCKSERIMEHKTSAPYRGPILIVLGIVVYLLRGAELALVLPIIGVVVIIAGVLYKPKKRPEPIND
jgi:hypothetical protein